MATYYVQNNGVGGGSSAAPANFNAIKGSLVSGDTVLLLDGIYQGANNMLQLPDGLVGAAGSPITIRALNDGGVTVDGQFGTPPVQFSNNAYITLEGVNAKNGADTVMGCYNSSFITLRRCIFWDTNITLNSLVTVNFYSDNVLWEDVAVFGAGCNMTQQHGTGPITFRRVWVRWEGSTTTGSGKIALDSGYELAPQFTCENCLVTADALCQPATFAVTDAAGRMPGDAGYTSNAQCAPDSSSTSSIPCPGTMLRSRGSVTLHTKNANFRSSMVYLPASYHGASEYPQTNIIQIPSAGANVSGIHINHLLGIVHPSHPRFSSLRGISLTNATSSPTDLIADRLTSVSGLGIGQDSQWVVTNAVTRSNLSFTAADSPYTGSTGGQLCYRWGTTTPLWPWPMNDRIKAATASAGSYAGPCKNCSGGRFARTATDVTADVQALLGTIPAPCVSGTTPPPPPAPIAAFSASPLTGSAPLTVQFHDESLNTPTAWEWTFGDSTGALTQNPSHIYTAAGTYDPALHVSNAGGDNTVSRFGYIVVGPTPPTKPTAEFTGSPTIITVPATVTFTDQSTNTPTSWVWNFGDATTSTSQNPTHTYTVAGTYTVSLAATNAGGTGTITKTGYIIASDPVPPPATPPVANFEGTPTSGTNPLSVSFTNLTTNLAPGANNAFAWTFGDGSCGTGCTPTHAYTSCGGYSVTLAVNDLTNCVSDSVTKENYILVTPAAPNPPTAAFSGVPTRGFSPLTVTYTDCSTNTPTSWAWTFGDGTCSTTQNPSHIYVECNRTYNVTLHAQNASGSDSETKTAYITVDAPIVKVRGRGHGKNRR